MMLMALVLLALLFLASLLHTLFNFPNKKTMPWLQSFFTKTTTSQDLHKAAKSTTTTTTTTTTVAAAVVAHNKGELRSVFATFDKNNDGFITKRELKESLGNIGIDITENEVVDMVEKVDSNGDGLIDLDEFCGLYESMVSREEVIGEEEEGGGKGVGEGDLKEAFAVFDGNGDGLITVEELGLVLSSLGLKEGKRVESCKEMISKVDMDGDGMVNFDEFKSMMKAGGRLLAVS
ncbi:hypothetical protein ACSBR2_005547 [Camellia fascicularis]